MNVRGLAWAAGRSSWFDMRRAAASIARDNTLTPTLSPTLSHRGTHEYFGHTKNDHANLVRPKIQ